MERVFKRISTNQFSPLMTVARTYVAGKKVHCVCIVEEAYHDYSDSLTKAKAVKTTVTVDAPQSWATWVVFTFVHICKQQKATQTVLQFSYSENRRNLKSTTLQNKARCHYVCLWMNGLLLSLVVQCIKVRIGSMNNLP